MQTNDREALEARVTELLQNQERAPEQPAPGGVGEEEIAALARTLGRTHLPADLRAWLRICRGEPIGPGGVFGIRPDQEFSDLARWPNWPTYGWLPVAGDGCGNYYVLLTSKGPLEGFVGFVDTMADPDLEQAPAELEPWNA